MHAVDATSPRASPHPASVPRPLIQTWRRFIRAMEDHYAAPVRHTPAEVLAAATSAARSGRQPPALPAGVDAQESGGAHAHHTMRGRVDR